ncbi:GRAM domain-containing protein [Sporosarcina ureae]|uniref:GRAM domain-containing protein n=1 Tax=Sporosarcina ureae TaxID=1571 RepID=UPI0028AFE0A5|nr:GRAM domain-containing protein [Sporosarcina ureae]
MTNYRENETVQYEIPVDLRKSIDYVSGNLFITNQRFIFQPQNMHFQRDILEFNIADINNIDSSYVLGIVPNGITVELKDGTLHTFVLESSLFVKCDEIIKTVWDLM